MKTVQFKAGSTRQEIEIANGGYRREFKRAEQPFEVEDVHLPMLLRTGEFEEVKAAPKALPPASQNAGAKDEKKDGGEQ